MNQHITIALFLVSITTSSHGMIRRSKYSNQRGNTHASILKKKSAHTNPPTQLTLATATCSPKLLSPRLSTLLSPQWASSHQRAQQLCNAHKPTQTEKILPCPQPQIGTNQNKIRFFKGIWNICELKGAELEDYSKFNQACRLFFELQQDMKKLERLEFFELDGQKVYFSRENLAMIAYLHRVTQQRE